MTPLQAKSLALLNLQRRENNVDELERKGDALRATIISEDEIENIMLGLMRTRIGEGRGCTTEELQFLINSIIGDRYSVGLSEMAGKGLLDITLDMAKPPGQRINYDIRADLAPEIMAELERRSYEGIAQAAKAA